MLNRDQWNRVLEQLVHEGLLTNVDFDQLCIHLRTDGLSEDEERLARKEKTPSNKMSKLLRYLRTRPSLEQGLRAGLQKIHEPLYHVMERAVTEVIGNEESLSNDCQFRSALRNLKKEFEVLSDWGLPGLLEVGCITISEEENIRLGKRKLLDILLGKSKNEWRDLIQFLEREHKDMFSVLWGAYDPTDLPVQVRLSESLSIQEQGCQASEAIKLSPPSEDTTGQRAFSAPVRAESETGRNSRHASKPPQPIDILLVLSNTEPILHSVRPDDTVQDIVDLLRRNRHLMGVKDIRIESSKSLMAQPNWRRMSMKDIGVEPGHCLTISTIQANAISAAVFDPKENESVMFETVTCDTCDTCDINVILNKLQVSSSNSLTPSIAIQKRTVYLRNSNRRYALESYDEATSSSVYIDEDDAKEVNDDQRTEIIFEFLSKGTGIRASASRIPSIEVYLDAEVLTMKKNGELTASTRRALFYPTAVILLRGMRLQDPNGDTSVFLLLLRGGLYVDVATGKTYRGREAATKAYGTVNKQWSFVFLLIKQNEILPQYSIPKEETLAVFVKTGTEVCVTGRRVSVRIPGRCESGSLWSTTFTTSSLDVSVTSEMRRK